jgi:peptidoglycan L-alanyl-D-glutamate endopeptidase CwlK
LADYRDARPLLIPPTVILITRQTVVLEDFRGDDLAESSSMVAQLLRGSV